MKDEEYREKKRNPPESFLVQDSLNERLLYLSLLIYKILITIPIFNYTRIISQSPTIIFVFTREGNLGGKSTSLILIKILKSGQKVENKT